MIGLAADVVLAGPVPSLTFEAGLRNRAAGLGCGLGRSAKTQQSIQSAAFAPKWPVNSAVLVVRIAAKAVIRSCLAYWPQLGSKELLGILILDVQC
jgi:hypothetical protein